jgi:hypothetical protein
VGLSSVQQPEITDYESESLRSRPAVRSGSGGGTDTEPSESCGS